jgi:hypothetical protein
MAKAETAHPHTEKTGAPASAPSPQNPLHPFDEAFKACLRALAEGQKDLCSRQEQEHRAYFEALQEPQSHVQRVWSEAQQELQRTWQTLADLGREAGPRWEEASREATEKVARAQQEAQEQLARAQSQLAESQGAAWTEANRRSEEALRNYVRAVQGALQGLDTKTFDLTLLAPVGQSLITIAGWAAGLREQ